MPTKKVKRVVYSGSIGSPFSGLKPDTRRKLNLKR